MSINSTGSEEPFVGEARQDAFGRIHLAYICRINLYASLARLTLLMHTFQQDYKRCIIGGLKWSFSASEINVKRSVAIIDFWGLLGSRKLFFFLLEL